MKSLIDLVYLFKIRDNLSLGEDKYCYATSAVSFSLNHLKYSACSSRKLSVCTH